MTDEDRERNTQAEIRLMKEEINTLRVSLQFVIDMFPDQIPRHIKESLYDQKGPL